MFVKMRPETCTKINDVFVAWPPQVDSHIEGTVENIDDELKWSSDPRSTGMIVYFQTSSILNDLGTKEVESVQRLLRRVFCDTGSLSITVSYAVGAKRSFKSIHAIENGLNLTHESV